MPAKKSGTSSKKGSKKAAKKGAPRSMKLAAMPMPASNPQGGEPVSGLAILTPDGKMFFISDSALQTFAVTRATSISALQEQMKAQGQGAGPGYQVVHISMERNAPDAAEIFL